MSELRDILLVFTELPMERMNALIALLALGLAALALFVVLTVLKGRISK